jgi:hypothetical protein
MRAATKPLKWLRGRKAKDGFAGVGVMKNFSLLKPGESQKIASRVFSPVTFLAFTVLVAGIFYSCRNGEPKQQANAKAGSSLPATKPEKSMTLEESSGCPKLVWKYKKVPASRLVTGDVYAAALKAGMKALRASAVSGYCDGSQTVVDKNCNASHFLVYTVNDDTPGGRKTGRACKVYFLEVQGGYAFDRAKLITSFVGTGY